MNSSERGRGAAPSPPSDEPDTKPCPRCAGFCMSPHTPDDCPAIDKKCNCCGKLGHLQAACCKKRKDERGGPQGKDRGGGNSSAPTKANNHTPSKKDIANLANEWVRKALADFSLQNWHEENSAVLDDGDEPPAPRGPRGCPHRDTVMTDRVNLQEELNDMWARPN